MGLRASIGLGGRLQGMPAVSCEETLRSPGAHVVLNGGCSPFLLTVLHRDYIVGVLESLFRTVRIRGNTPTLNPKS